MSDSLLMLLEMIEEVLEEQKALLTEGQIGTAFERVIVQIAGGPPAGEDEANYKHSGSTLGDLAKKALQKMGVEPGSDPNAKVISSVGISGDPKTDVVIDGKKISLKLPGNIQLGSGGVAITGKVFKQALREFAKQEAREEAAELLQEQLTELTGYLEQSAGKFYPAEGYEEALTKKFIGRGMDPTEAAEKARSLNEKAIRDATNDWAKWNTDIKKLLNDKMKDLLEKNPDYLTIIIDEYLTGRATFKNQPDYVADYLLSPDSFYDITTPEKTSELIDDKFSQALKVQARGKGRPNLFKEVSVRFEFNQKVFETLKKAALIKESCSDNNITEQKEKCSLPDEKIKELAITNTIVEESMEGT